HFVCLTAKGLGTILCLLATLPVGFSRPIFEDIEKTRFFDVNPLVSLFVAVGRKGDTFGCAGFSKPVC
ncbi:hypothetical protein, partial [Acinetobacter lactucae]|uniref:hypothetical protein n=1 Tax=Acinetobacter lactucae TaxID=1785128 RepID=UPI001C2EBE38